MATHDRYEIDILKAIRHFNDLIKQMYAEKRCGTCKHCALFFNDSSGFLDMFTVCKLTGDLPIKTCENYECDGMMDQRIVSVNKED